MADRVLRTWQIQNRRSTILSPFATRRNYYPNTRGLKPTAKFMTSIRDVVCLCRGATFDFSRGVLTHGPWSQDCWRRVATLESTNRYLKTVIEPFFKLINEAFPKSPRSYIRGAHIPVFSNLGLHFKIKNASVK
jgi:hypothetical protein